MTTFKIPTVLSFNRKLEPSDALMFSGKWKDVGKNDGWKAIELFERKNRAVKSNFTQEVLADEEALMKQIEEPNIAWGDDAALPADSDTLKVSFSLRIMNGINTPSACNNKEFQDKFTKIINICETDLGFETLASRYAYNIVNGRFLWRNRVGAEEIEVHVKHKSLEKSLKFNAYEYPLKNTTTSDEKVTKVTNLIKLGFSNEDSMLIEIDAFVKLGILQRIWPSQEMVLNSPKGEKSRTLFALNGNAAMHCEKIGNALRTIDDWQEGSDQPIAIEAYGSVTQQGTAYRSSNNDFKTLITKWINDKEISPEDKHFVVAMIIRGGVFSEGE